MQRIMWSELWGKGTGLPIRCLPAPMAFIRRKHAVQPVKISLIYAKNPIYAFFFTSLFSVFNTLKPAFDQIDFLV